MPMIKLTMCLFNSYLYPLTLSSFSSHSLYLSHILLPSNATNKAEARTVLLTAVSASEVNDIEFLLEYHLTESQQLEYEVSGTLKRLENVEQSVSE